MNGPDEGDAVMITDSPMLAAIAAGRMDARQAHRHGLMKLHCPDDARGRLAALIEPFHPQQRGQP